jgi:hypothetical protein
MTAPQIKKMRPDLFVLSSSKIPQNAVQVRYIHHYITEAEPTKDPVTKKLTPKPWSFCGYITEAAIVSYKPKKDEVVEGPIRTMTVKPLTVQYFRSFNERVHLRPGHEYILDGVVFTEYVNKDGVLTSSLNFSQAMPTGATLATLSLTFEQTSIDLERDCKSLKQSQLTAEKHGAFVVMKLENDPTLFDAATDVSPSLSGYFSMPSTLADQNLCVKVSNVEQIAFRGDPKNNPTIACTQNDGKTKTKFAVSFGGYAEQFLPFCLDLEEWKKLGGNIIPHLTGLVFGCVNRVKTRELIALDDEDDIAGVLALDEAALYDVEKVIRRAGVAVDKEHLAPFLRGQKLDRLTYEEWKTSYQYYQTDLNVINLNTVSGDASNLPASVEYIVVSSHNMSDEHLAAVQAEPDVTQRVATLTGDSSARISGQYGRDKPVFAVYAIGEKVRSALA